MTVQEPTNVVILFVLIVIIIQINPQPNPIAVCGVVMLMVAMVFNLVAMGIRK